MSSLHQYKEIGHIGQIERLVRGWLKTPMGLFFLPIPGDIWGHQSLEEDQGPIAAHGKV